MKMQYSYRELVKIVEENKDLSKRKLAAKIGKSHTWVNKLIQFITASEEEKIILSQKDRAYKALYNLYLQEIKNNSSEIKNNENVEEKKTTEITPSLEYRYIPQVAIYLYFAIDFFKDELRKKEEEIKLFKKQSFEIEELIQIQADKIKNYSYELALKEKIFKYTVILYLLTCFIFVITLLIKG